MLNPQSSEWKSWFAPGESPYFMMYRAGCCGIPIEEISRHCSQMNIPLREKDVRNWSNGYWKHKIKSDESILNPVLKPNVQMRNLLTSDYEHLERLPEGWTGTDLRWFPCTQENRPMQKWGYADGFIPQLYDRASARALSPCGWVGQNMYMQPFVVIDIDGEGHGAHDDMVIQFGSEWIDRTECWMDPTKPGSFHLYFSTDRIVPIMHFNYAKLDLMGNQKNAAVYTKNKQSNGIPRACLSEIWDQLKCYVEMRKRLRDQSH